MRHSPTEGTSKNFSSLPTPILPTSLAPLIPQFVSSSVQRPTPINPLGKRELQLDINPLQMDLEKKMKSILQDGSLNVFNIPQNLPELPNHKKPAFDLSVGMNGLQDQAVLNMMMNQMSQANQMNHGLQALHQAQYVQLLLEMRNRYNATQNLNNLLQPNGKMLGNLMLDLRDMNMLGYEKPKDVLVPKIENIETEINVQKNLKPTHTEKINKPILKERHQEIVRKYEVPVEGMPMLAEFTKVYPDWDLCTIFEFVQSGKSLENFEIERNIKLNKKREKIFKRKSAKSKQRLQDSAGLTQENINS